MIGDAADAGSAAQSVYDPMPWDASDPSGALNQYINSWGNSYDTGQTFQMPSDPTSVLGWGSGSAPAYTDPAVAFANTGYPYYGHSGEPDVYGLYQDQYQGYNGLSEG